MNKEPNFSYEFWEEGSVLMQDMTDWEGSAEGLDYISKEWLELTAQEHIDASVTLFGPDLLLGGEAQAELEEEWARDSQQADVERVAYVSDGIEARAVTSKIDPEHEIRTFKNRENALEWAKSV